MNTIADKWGSLGKTPKMIISILIALILIGGGVGFIFREFMKPQQFEQAINLKYERNSGVIVDMDTSDRAQVEAAVCMVSVMATGVIGQPDFKTLVFRQKGEPLSTNIATAEPDLKDRLTLSDIGSSRGAISRGIALKYWSTIDTAVVVSTYEEALYTAPMATLINAPILYDSKDVITLVGEKNIKNLILVGHISRYDSMANRVGLKVLEDRNAVWEYYLQTAREKGVDVNYIIITNPSDTRFDDSSFYTPGMSLPSTYLAVCRNALVVTGNYTAKRNWTCELGYGTGDAGSGERGGDDDTLTDEQERSLQQLIDEKAVQADNDIDMAYSFLSVRGFIPKYVAIGGGPSAVPMIYIKSPIWYEGVKQEEKGEEYLSTDQFFGDIELRLTGNGSGEYTIENNFGHMRDEVYTQELSVGRIVAASLQDASGVVARSVGYLRSYYTQNLMVDQTMWWQQATVVTSLMTGTSDNAAANEQVSLFTQNKVLTHRVDPRGVPLEWVTGEDTLKLKIENSNALIYDGHGYPDGWYYLWSSTSDKDNNWDRIGSEDIYRSNLHAIPVFGACCLSSALDWPMVWSGGSKEAEMPPENCMSLAFLHAGASAYIGATEESWGSFLFGLFDGQPDKYGYGDFDMASMFYRGLFENDLTVGEALAAAKVSFYGLENLKETARPFARTCVLETALYGDPAAPWTFSGEGV